LTETLTGQVLADLMHKEQEVLAKEVRWLQDKSWKVRRRAGERIEYNTEHPAAKDLLTKSSADGDSTATTQG